jgi:hypothetical protein
MKPITILTAAIFAVGALNVSLDAQGRGNGQAKKTSVSTSTVKPATTAKPAAHSTKPVKAETKSPKATTTTKHAAKATTKAETRTAKNETKVARTSATTTQVGTTTTTVTPTTPTTQKVKNPKLESRLLALLPAGTNIQDASQGFKNWGQFVAAAHVSNNLGIPFADLKARMTGVVPGGTVPPTTPTTTMSLGQAIQSLKGTATTPETGDLSPTKIRTEVKKAEDAADLELRSTRD